MANVVLYRRYPVRYGEHDPVCASIRETAEERDLGKKKVSVLHKLCGGLAYGTVRNMLNGTTRYPRHMTAMAILGALGVDLVQKTGKFDLEAELADAQRWNQRREATKLLKPKKIKSKQRNGKSENRAAL